MANILFVSDLAGMGGGEVSLLHIMEYLSKNNSVYLLCRVPGSLVEICKRKGIDVFCYDFKRNLMRSYKNFRTIIKENNIDVIHSNELTTSILHGIFSKNICKNLKNVCTCHGQWYKLSNIKRILINIFVEHIFCVSLAVQKNLISQKIKNTSVSYLGVPEENFVVSADENEALRNELAINKHSIVVATIGRFQIIKGQLKGLQAIEKAHQVYSNIIYLLVGDNVFGSELDAKYKESVMEYVSSHKMNAYVKLLGERQDVPAIMSLSDFIMITSDNESFGMVAIEAIAAKRIIVSTPCDGVREILEDDENMISPTNDGAGLCRCLMSLINDKNKAFEAACKIEKLKNKFSIKEVCEKYLKIYME